MKKTLLLAPALLLLAACAPSTGGSGGGGGMNPQVMDSPTTPVKLKPGETKYVRYDYPRSAVKVNDQYFRDLKIDFNDRSGMSVRSPSAYAPYLKMTATASAGLNVSLAYASIVKEIVDTSNKDFNSSSETNVQFYELVRVTLKVTADATAKPGLKTVTLNFTDGNTPSSVPLIVNVQE